MKKKQVTIKDIARKLGISFSTVSRALSPHASIVVKTQTRDLVRQTAAAMDYSPNLIARGMVMGKTGTLGLLTYQISRETSGRQIDQILRMADKQNYQILLRMAAHRTPLSPMDDQVIQIKQLISRGIDGLLINTRGDGEESERILNIVRGQVPVVTFHYPTHNLSGVVLDLVADFYAATEHLIELGHERIGFIGPDWDETSPVSAKGKGYFLAMQKHGLTPEFLPALGIYAEGGYIQSKRLGDRFTALLCRDDYTAIGVCRGLRELGLRVPEDVAVVGHGDIDVSAYVTPSLTTLVTPYEAIAQAAMDLMLEQLQGQDEPRQVTLRSHLIVRESCGTNKSEE